MRISKTFEQHLGSWEVEKYIKSGQWLRAKWESTIGVSLLGVCVPGGRYPKRSNVFLQKMNQRTRECLDEAQSSALSSYSYNNHICAQPAYQFPISTHPGTRGCEKTHPQKVRKKASRCDFFFLFLMKSHPGILLQWSWQWAWQPRAHNLESFQLSTAQFLNTERQCCMRDHQISQKSSLHTRWAVGSWQKQGQWTRQKT